MTLMMVSLHVNRKKPAGCGGETSNLVGLYTLYQDTNLIYERINIKKLGDPCPGVYQAKTRSMKVFCLKFRWAETNYFKLN